ncbi:hypothetical protein EON64_12360, partial [archaeon]
MAANSTVSVGYWRLTTSAPQQPCLHPFACPGGRGQGDALCAPGYSGYLCGETTAPFYFDWVTQEAAECGGLQVGGAFFLLLLAALVLAI